jgi:hypothetical protein
MNTETKLWQPDRQLVLTFLSCAMLVLHVILLLGTPVQNESVARAAGHLSVSPPCVLLTCVFPVLSSSLT